MMVAREGSAEVGAGCLGADAGAGAAAGGEGVVVVVGGTGGGGGSYAEAAVVELRSGFWVIVGTL